jgi:hypothetical protein
MFHELTDEMLDLEATDKGVGYALLANEELQGGGTGCSSSSTLSSSLCCSIHLCI